MFEELVNMDGMLVDDNTADGSRSSECITIEGDVELDLPSYISAYHGYIYYQRLFFIAKNCPTQRITALRLAHDYIKKETFDTSAYCKVFFMLAEQAAASQGLAIATGDQNNPSAQVGQIQDAILIPGAGEIISSGTFISDAAKLTLNSVMAGQNEAGLSYDVVWEQNTRRQNAIRLDQMDTELKNYKANLIKESIRRGYDAIGHTYLKMGRLEDARKCYVRTRDHCTSEQQEISTCLNIIKVAIFKGHWALVNASVSRAYNLLEMRDAIPSKASSAAAAAAAAALAAANAAAAARTGLYSATTSTLGAAAAASTSSSHASGVPRIGADLGGTATVATGGSGGGHRDWIAQCRTALAIASGLVDLSCNNFRGAALKFIQVHPDHLESPTSSLVSQSDLALLVTLCSLASFDRTELARLVLGSSAMRSLLEAEPVCRDMLQAFHQADYSFLLTRLSPPVATSSANIPSSSSASAYSDAGGGSGGRVSTALRDQIRLDLFMACHYTQLVGNIRAKSICQYFSPYSSVNMTIMATAFHTTVPELENELTSLIQQGSIKARIDSHNQILRVVKVDQRCMTYSRVLQLADEYQKQTHSAILLLSLTHQKLLREPKEDDIERKYNLRSRGGISWIDKLHALRERFGFCM